MLSLNWSRLLLLLLAGAVPAGDALAQPVMPSARRDSQAATMPKRQDNQNNADIARKLLDDFGKCLVSLHPELARDVIYGPTQPERTRKRIASTTDCLRGERGADLSIRFNSDLLRGAVYKAFYARDHQMLPVVPAVASPWAADFLGVSKANITDQAAYVTLRNLGQCLTEAEPSAVHTVLVNDAGSAAEAEAFKAIMPRIGGCLSEGVTVQLSRAILIGILAEVSQRLATPG